VREADGVAREGTVREADSRGGRWAAALPHLEQLDLGSPKEAFELLDNVLPLTEEDIFLCAHSIYHPLSHSIPTSSNIYCVIMDALHVVDIAATGLVYLDIV